MRERTMGNMKSLIQYMGDATSEIRLQQDFLIKPLGQIEHGKILNDALTDLFLGIPIIKGQSLKKYFPLIPNFHKKSQPNGIHMKAM